MTLGQSWKSKSVPQSWILQHENICVCVYIYHTFWDFFKLHIFLFILPFDNLKSNYSKIVEKGQRSLSALQIWIATDCRMTTYNYTFTRELHETAKKHSQINLAFYPLLIVIPIIMDKCSFHNLQFQMSTTIRIRTT